MEAAVVGVAVDMVGCVCVEVAEVEVVAAALVAVEVAREAQLVKVAKVAAAAPEATGEKEAREVWCLKGTTWRPQPDNRDRAQRHSA